MTFVLSPDGRVLYRGDLAAALLVKQMTPQSQLIREDEGTKPNELLERQPQERTHDHHLHTPPEHR